MRLEAREWRARSGGRQMTIGAFRRAAWSSGDGPPYSRPWRRGRCRLAATASSRKLDVHLDLSGQIRKLDNEGLGARPGSRWASLDRTRHDEWLDRRAEAMGRGEREV